ncbi:MAG: class I SAM-dependent methyltransferase, partial [Casimicrobiaceae bacterium]
TDLLATVAASAVGVDRSAEAVAHARAQYRREGLRFLVASCTDIPLPEASFDLIVSFETIEHIDDQAGFLAEVDRLLAPGGLFLMSSPNRPEYSEKTGYCNEFHVRELDREELAALLAPHFVHQRWFGQRAMFHSMLWPIERAAAEAQSLTLDGGAASPEPVYFIVAAAREAETLAAAGPALDALTWVSDREHSVHAAWMRTYQDNHALVAENERLRKRIITLEAKQSEALAGWAIDTLPRASAEPGVSTGVREALHNAASGMQCEARGAQRPKPNKALGEGASTAQQSNAPAQQVRQSFLSDSTGHAALISAITRSNRPRVLVVSHGLGGGVERHVLDRIARLRPTVDLLVLRGAHEGNVEVAFYGELPRDDTRVLVGGFGATAAERWAEALAAIGFERVELHHLHGWPRPAVDRLLERLLSATGCPLVITLHDYALVSPRYHLEDEEGRYAGPPSLEDAASREWFDWGRRLLERAANILAPTHDVARRFNALLPGLSITVRPHEEPPLVIPRLLKVGLIGGLSRIKGLDVVKAVADRVAVQRLPIAIRLIGHASEPLPPAVTATGTYEEAELPALLASERIDVFWFPHQVPETWNYALSAAMATGRPIIASDLGSSRERLANDPQAKLVPFDAAPECWLEALCTACRFPVQTQAASAEPPTAAITTTAGATHGATGSPTPASRPSTDALAVLLETAAAPKPVAPYPLLTFHRLGRYAGHRASADAVEQHLQAIGEGETAIVGRTAYDAVSAHRDALLAEREELLTQRNELLEERDELLTQRAELLETLGRVNAELLATSEHLMAITRSRSWRWTRPLRGAHLGARLVKGLLGAPGRAPAALSALRRNGLRAAIEATRPTTEAEQLSVPAPAAPDAAPVASPPPEPITPALSAEFPTAVRLFPERLKSPWWIGHIPFAFELIARHRPQTIVELGTYSGSSFAAFCQALESCGIDGVCFGVDLWEGDVHMGRFDESLFLEMRAFAESRYPKHARLIRKRFDQAVHDFADGSIDLLHIDGTHTYEAVRNDFETWLPKLGARGIVLFHDIHVTEENCGPSARKFGVRRLFDEVKLGRPHCEFLHCFGLGVLVVGREVSPELLGFIERCHAPEVQAFFAALGDRVLAHYHALGEPPPVHDEYGEPESK